MGEATTISLDLAKHISKPPIACRRDLVHQVRWRASASAGIGIITFWPPENRQAQHRRSEVSNAKGMAAAVMYQCACASSSLVVSCAGCPGSQRSSGRSRRADGARRAMSLKSWNRAFRTSGPPFSMRSMRWRKRPNLRRPQVAQHARAKTLQSTRTGRAPTFGATPSIIR